MTWNEFLEGSRKIDDLSRDEILELLRDPKIPMPIHDVLTLRFFKHKGF